MFSPPIRDNVSLVETLSNGQNVFIYKKGSYDAKDCVALATKFL
ncbi:hypothetical protein WCP94_003897 [Bilophila wadsworthia]